MLRELLPLLTALAAAAVIYVMRERRRRRMRIVPPRPEVTMREVCESPTLLAIEQAALAADDPRSVFRRAALENAVAALYLETIAELGTPDTVEMLHTHGEAWRALREYLRLKYDDAVADDWFEHFVRMARPYIREKVRLTHVEPYERIYDELLQELMNDALMAPQKKTFVPPDFKLGPTVPGKP